MNDPVISVDGVSKDFLLPHERISSVKALFTHPFRTNTVTTQHALKDVSFQIKEGEFFGIVGRNGSGKSTLLKIIAGIYQPTKGSVVVRGRLVPFIELGVGFNPELSGKENVFLNGALMGFSTKEISSKYQAIVDFAEIPEFMDQQLKNYSSGMQVRLAFSVATILAESDILLIDEVLAVGDASFQKKCFEYFRKLKRDGKTVIFVSHDMGAIREFCDRAVLIEGSKKIFEGSAEDVSKEYTRLFLTDVYKEQALDDDRKKKDSSKRNEVGSNKWGAGGITVKKPATDKGVYNEDDKTIEVTYRVVTEKSFAGGINPGITIRNQKGEEICGSNSAILRVPKSKTKLGPDRRSIDVSWKIPNIFGEGKFLVDATVLSENGETLEWWEESTSFRTINEYSTSHPVSPVIFVKIK